MSGDWIKVENSTPNKPEILRMARILGIHRDEAFGKAMRFWLWVDGISVDGRVDGVASTDIDGVVDATGFSAALSDVGWAVFDDSKLVMTVPNFDRHNGQSAKARGLRTKRQAKWRGKTVDAHVDAAPSTTASPEKRREEKRILTNVSKPRPSIDEVQSYATEIGCTDAEGFFDYYQANGWKVGRNPMKDWKSALRNWKRRQPEFASSGRKGEPAPTAALNESYAEAQKRIAKTRAQYIDNCRRQDP